MGCTNEMTAIRSGNSIARPLRIVHTVSSLKIGGMEQVVLRLARAQRSAGHRVGILALAGGPLEQTMAGDDLQLCVLGGGRLLRGVSSLRYFRSTRPDVIHVHNPTSLHYAVLSKLVARPALVLTVHGEMHARRGTALEWRQVAAVAVVSHAALRTLRLPCDPRKFTVIHNGIAPPSDSPDLRAATRRNLCLGDRIAGTIVARMNGRKGHATLLKSMSMLRDAGEAPLMLVVGDGPEREQLEKQAQELNLDASHVRFLGARSDVDHILRAADFFVLPSDTEGLPLSVLEAMAHGLPVVASRVGGIPEIIEDGQQGLLVSPGDPAALRNAIQRIVDDAVLRRRLGKAAAIRVNAEFSVSSTLQNYDRLYRTALSS